MFTPKVPEPQLKLDDAIDEVLRDMVREPADSPEYAKMMVHLQTLYKLKEQNVPKRVSPDTVAIVLGNLAGIVLILGHERLHVVSSRALSFVLKPR